MIKLTNKGEVDPTARLVKAFQAGDTSAFSRLYDLYIHILYNYGYKLTLDKEMLKDCIHDVFVKLYMKRTELDRIGNFRSYLFISLKNKIVDEMRHGAYTSAMEVEDLSPVASDDIEGEFLFREKTNRDNKLVRHLLAQLSPRQREAITLYYIEERDYEDICQMMDMNYQSVRNLMHRGLSRLKEIAL